MPRHISSARVLCSLVLAVVCLAPAAAGAAERPRLAVLTDIGGDPDDQQSMIRLMVYSNEFDIELLAATAAGTRGELKESITRPDLIRRIIDAYAEALPNLQRHAAGWPARKRFAPVSSPAITFAAGSTSARVTIRRRRGR